MNTGFGAFIAPSHEPGQDPQLSLRRDIQLVKILDELNYDEAWFGEHHSLGWGIIGAPETIIAAISQQTTRIKLANGVVPLSWHHPFHVATRAVHLDQLSRGRYILGVGPGVPTDARMLGVEVSEQRTRLTEALPTVLELVNGDERVNDKTDWYLLRDAKVQLPRYSRAGVEVAVATAGSTPVSPMLVGRYGLSMASFGMGLPGARSSIDLAKQWRYAQESAEEHGQTVDRRNWRISVPLHVAETRKEALDDVRAGFDRYLHGYWEETIGFDVTVPGVRRAVELEAQIENGGAIVGSVEDVVNGLNRLHERSGGFGTFLVTVLDWTSWEKTIRSFDLLARYVAPHFTGSTSSLRDSIDWAAQSRARANAVS